MKCPFLKHPFLKQPPAMAGEGFVSGNAQLRNASFICANVFLVINGTTRRALGWLQTWVRATVNYEKRALVPENSLAITFMHCPTPSRTEIGGHGLSTLMGPCSRSDWRLSPGVVDDSHGLTCAGLSQMSSQARSLISLSRLIRKTPFTIPLPCQS